MLPFVRMFCCTPSQFLWEDELGIVNHIPQGGGSEQGDPLMPFLFSLGQHRALTSVAGELHRGEQLFAFHDDLYDTAQPDRVVDINHSWATRLWSQARITLHQSKTVTWNKAGICPLGCHVLGVPVGRPEFIMAMLEAKSRQHSVLFDKIISVGDPESAWCLLFDCAAARVNFWLRSVHPELSGEFAREHDASTSTWPQSMTQLKRQLLFRWQLEDSVCVPLSVSATQPTRQVGPTCRRRCLVVIHQWPPISLMLWKPGSNTQLPVSSQLCRHPCWNWFRGACMGSCGCQVWLPKFGQDQVWPRPSLAEGRRCST